MWPIVVAAVVRILPLLVSHGCAIQPTLNQRALYRAKMVRPTSRDTNIATVLRDRPPARASAPPAANGLTGVMSLRPTLVSVVKLRNSSSHPAAIFLWIDRGDEAARLDRLADNIRVSEHPGHQRERGPDGKKLVARNLMVRKHVRDHRSGGVELEDGLESGRVRQELVAAGRSLDQQQHGCGNSEQIQVRAGDPAKRHATNPRMAMPRTLNSARPAWLSSANG